MANLSPMMTQYFEIKEKYKDYILFFRVGDFYEMFFDDAKLVSKELELTLTGKECGLDEDLYAYRERTYDEILPWDFIDIGVNRKYLERENEKAKKAELTQNCRKGCTGCGVNVNFKEGECFEGAILS